MFPSAFTFAPSSRPALVIVTSVSPARRASQAARILTPFPESSAIEPSGFQMRTSAWVPAAETTSSNPSEPTP